MCVFLLFTFCAIPANSLTCSPSHFVCIHSSKAAFSVALLLGCHMTDRFSRLNFLHYWETSIKNMQLKDEIRTLNMAGQRNEAWGAMLNTPMERILRELRLLSRSNPKDVPVKHRRVLQDIVSILSSTISLDLPDISGQLGAGGGDMISQNLLYTLGGQSGKRTSAPSDGPGGADGNKSSPSHGRKAARRTFTLIGPSEVSTQTTHYRYISGRANPSHNLASPPLQQL